jgi:uncharacterized protein
MQNRLAFPIVLFSVFMVGIFGVQWLVSQNRVETLTIATGARTGKYYAFARSLANVIAKYQPNIHLRVIETEGSLQNEKLLQENKAQLALIQSDTLVSPSTKAVSFLFPEMFHLIATKKSGIESVSDLKGKRIALMPQGSGSYALFWSLSQHYDLKPTDFKTFALPPDEAYKAFKQGKVDALFRAIALSNSEVSQLLQNNSAKLIPIDQAAALQLSQPALEASKIPKGTYNGAIPIPDRDLPVVAVRAVLVARKDVDQNLIYEITRILYESRNELVKEIPQASSIRQPNSLIDLGFSFHPGAKAYYNQDEPSFIVQYAEPLGLLFSISVFAVSGMWQLRMWLQGKQKNRADLYNLEIVKIIEQIDAIDDLEQLAKIRCQLYEIFEKVIVDLDEDRISPASFQSFSFPWEVALTTIRHRETLLVSTRQQLEAVNGRSSV